MKTGVRITKPALAKNETQYELKAATLVDVLKRPFESTHHRLIFINSKNDEFSLHPGEILQGAEAAAHYLLAQGLEKADKVIILLPTGSDFVKIFFGVLMAGGIPIPSPQPIITRYLDKYLNTIRHMVINSEAKFFIGYDRIRHLVGGLREITLTDLQYRNVERVLDGPPPGADDHRLPAIQPSDIALIQYTSGTLGRPKGVMLSHENLLHNVHALGMATGMTTEDVGINWLPLYHDMGLIGTLFSSLYWQWPLILMSPETFLLKPHSWMQNISHYRATLAVSPNFGYSYCTRKIAARHLGSFDLTSWRLAINGAEPINMKTLNAFLDRFGPQGLRRNVFFPVYGMAENCLAATMPPLAETTTCKTVYREKLERDGVAQIVDDPAAMFATDVVSVGRPIPGHTIRIVDKNGALLAEKEIGEVHVKSRCVTRGYQGDPRATASVIENGWLKTGDLGFLLDGLLYITGRSKEMIIRAGKNYYPYDIERIAETVAGVRKGCCAAFSLLDREAGEEKVVLICESRVEDADQMEEMKRRINAQLVICIGISADMIKIAPPGAVPKTSSGKVQRILCRDYYLKDRLAAGKYKNYRILIRTILSSHLLHAVIFIKVFLKMLRRLDNVINRRKRRTQGGDG